MNRFCFFLSPARLMRCTLFCLALMSAPAFSVSMAVAQQIPETLSYQGILTDVSGTPLADGTYSVQFRFYETPTGGAPVVILTAPATTRKGLFSVILGANDTLTNNLVPFLIGQKQHYIGITVNGGAELAPRVQLTTVPYSISAFKAVSALTASTATVATTATTAGSADFAVNAAHATRADTATVALGAALTLPFTGTQNNAAALLALTNTNTNGGAAISASGSSLALRATAQGSGTAIQAQGDGAATTALDIRNGALKTSGTTRFAFTVTAATGASGNTAGGKLTLDNALINGDPNAIVFAQPTGVTFLEGSGNTPKLNAPYGVFFFAPDGGGLNKWQITALDTGNIPNGAKFTVIVIKQ